MIYLDLLENSKHFISMLAFYWVEVVEIEHLKDWVMYKTFPSGMWLKCTLPVHFVCVDMCVG